MSNLQTRVGAGQTRFDWDRHFHFGGGLSNLDAQQNIFFQRELEHIIPEMFEKEYALINARRIFPIDRSAGGAVKSITWRQFEKFGQAQVISDYADDINVVNVAGEEFTTPVRGLAVGAQWSIQEIREAQSENRPLDRMFSDAARETMLRTENASVFAGDPAFGIQGLATVTNGIPRTPVPNGSWLTATAADILTDLNFLANTIVETTGDVEVPDTLIMPTRHYNRISQLQNSVNATDTTALSYFLRNNQYINEVIPVRELDTAFGVGVGPVAMAYKRDPSKIRMQVPLDIEQFAPQEHNLVTQVIWHMRIGGLTVHKPGSALIGTGI